MLDADRPIAALATELQARLGGGALAGLCPVTLTAGPFADAELAARILLAALDHLGTLASTPAHRPPRAEDRLALLADDVRLLLLLDGDRRDGATDARDDSSALTA